MPAGREAGLCAAPPGRALFYQIIEEYYPAFKQHLEAQAAYLPGYVEQEFEDNLKCGRLEYGFLRMRCEACQTEHLIAFSCKRRVPRCWLTRSFPSSRCSNGC